MLPHIKRPQRAEEGDVEIEVVDVRNVDGSEISDDDPTMLATNTLFPKKKSDSSRPATSSASKKPAVFGDEPTRLMPSKHGAKSSLLQSPPISVPPPAASRPASSRPPASALPSASVRPGALPEPRGPSSRAPHSSPPPPNVVISAPTAAEFRPTSVKPSSRVPPPPAFRDREESQTMLRPLGALAEQAHEPKVALAVPSAGAIKAQVDAARAKRLSDRMADQKARAAETLEVTPVSISERFVVKGRPAAPWAVAFVAMGVFAGLATAVFTGGRASAIAAFIDPGHEAVAAAAQPVAPPPAAPASQPANDPAASLLAGSTPQANAATPTTDPAAALAATPASTTNVFAVGHASTKSADTTPAPAAKPTPKAEPKPVVAKADPPAPKSDPKPVAAAEPKPASDTSSSSSSHSSHSSRSSGKHSGGGGGDVDSAAAADALAKAQLENSL